MNRFSVLTDLILHDSEKNACNICALYSSLGFLPRFGYIILTIVRDSLSASLRCDNVLARRTLGPDSVCAIILLVFNQSPRDRYALTAIRTPTEYLCVVGHGKGDGRSV